MKTSALIRLILDDESVGLARAALATAIVGFVFAPTPSKLIGSALERIGVALGLHSGGLRHRCRQFLVHRFKQAIGCSPSGGREAADDPADVVLLHRDRFRRRLAPDDRSCSSIHQLRRNRANGGYVAALVHFLQPSILPLSTYAASEPRSWTDTLLKSDWPRRPSSRYCVTAWRGFIAQR